MLVFGLILCILILFSLSCRKDSKGNDISCLCREQTDSLKGIGIIVVFFNHITGYLNQNSLHPIWDKPFLYIVGLFTALFVGLFLFFSGYGVTESFKTKGKNYINRIPQHRILQTLINFDIAVLCFVVLTLFIGGDLSFKKIVLSLVAWDSLGNSNWYIFCILICYLFSFVAFKLSSKATVVITIMTVLSIIYIVIISSVKSSYWFNTILAYPAGVLYSFYRDSINKSINAHFCMWLMVTLSFFIGLFYISTNNPYTYNFAAVAFCFLIVVLSSKLLINNNSLKWCGQHLFPLYIYQRLSMILFASLWPSFVSTFPMFYCLICLLITALIARVIPIVKI